MLGRRAVAAVAVSGAVAFGGGAALAATHGSSHAAKPRPAKHAPSSNVHYPCRHHGGGTASAAV